MKKKILFIVSNMESGGVSKSMSSLLNIIDTDRYEIDCFILNPVGLFMKTIPSGISLIEDRTTSIFFSDFKNAIWKLLIGFRLRLLILRLLAAFCSVFNKGLAGWFLSKGIKKTKKKYDVAVDYNGQHLLYFLVDGVNAKEKISFFHSDYEKWSYYFRMDCKYYPKVNHIFTISEHCVKSMRQFFPSESHKIELFPNLLSKKLIERMANEIVEDNFDTNVFSILTVGHLLISKGIKLALECAGKLKERELNFKWYFLGDKSEEMYFYKLACQLKVEKNIVFMGLRSNPYPYFKQASIIVHPSQFEGKSIALDEAKLLAKPIVVTNFSTVYDQFEDRKNASICKMEVESLTDNIWELIHDKDLQIQYSSNLKMASTDNTSAIERLYTIIDNSK